MSRLPESLAQAPRLEANAMKLTAIIGREDNGRVSLRPEPDISFVPLPRMGNVCSIPAAGGLAGLMNLMAEEAAI